MKVRRIFVFLVLMLSLSLAMTDFTTNYAKGALDSENLEITADLPGAALENDQTVTLEPDITSSKSACPGLIVEYFLLATNGSIAEETLNFTTSGNIWTTIIEPPSLTLPAGESDYISVSVQIPWSANPGDQDAATITASAQTSGLSDSVVLTTRTAIAKGWEDEANSPADRGTRAPSVVYWDGKLYKIGGFGYEGTVGGARPWLDIYDIASDSWRQGADMPAGRYWIDCEAIDLTGSDPKIYCAGGYVSSGKNTLYIYDINTDAWANGASLPEERYNYASVVHNNLYYVIGGVTTGHTNTMLVYNPAANTWDSSKAPMAEARRYFSAGLIGSKIYAAGGYNGDYLSSLEVYDIATDSWLAGAELPTPWVNAADGVVHDRFLLLVGGAEDSYSGASNRAMVYDAVHDSWSRLPIFNHAIYSAEGGGDGVNFWVASGRLYEETFQNSTYITKMVDCDEGVCVPVSGPDFIWAPTSPVVGSPITFTATVEAGTLPVTYAWDFGDGATGTGANPEHTFTTSGTYTVTLTVSNCDSASTDFISHDVTVSDVCVPVSGPDFIWAPTSPVVGSPITFTATVEGGTLPVTYAWDFGDGATGTGANPEHTFATSETYTVTLTVSNCGGESTNFVSHDVTVLPLPTSIYLYLPLIVH